ncbi:hypothetical protein [Dechloromonas sp. ZS-1]
MAAIAEMGVPSFLLMADLGGFCFSARSRISMLSGGRPSAFLKN